MKKLLLVLLVLCIGFGVTVKGFAEETADDDECLCGVDTETNECIEDCDVSE